MTDQEINIAIAEACGTRNGTSWNIHSNGIQCVFPDYCHDLNAMHEVERTLLQTPKDLWWVFVQSLNDVVCSDFDEPINYDPETLWNMIYATARQRSEAFLRTKGLWKEKGTE